MGHVAVRRSASVRVRESLELVACFVGIHLFAEAEQVERSVRADFIVNSCKSESEKSVGSIDNKIKSPET